MLRPRFTPAALMVVLAFGPAMADAPRPLALDQAPLHPNQQLANAIVQQLRASGQLQGYRIEVTCRNGNAELNGFVASAEQRDEAVRLAQGVPGVARILNGIQVVEPVARTQYPLVLDQQPELVPAPRKVEGQDPVPTFRAGPQNPIQQLPPPMPPYAWPTYAPYNNYSRVAYPNAYPREALPYIGPVHPFPKVPLGWRAVLLQWDDGHWWLSTHGIKHDWWVLRYW